MKKILFALLSVLFIVACQDEVEFVPENNTPQQVLDGNQYAIPIDSALAYLEAFLNQGELATRGTQKRVVSSITPIKYNNLIISRSGQEDVDCENLLYVANFEDEQGYAILSGDSRINGEVLAVVDKGSICDSTIYTALQLTLAERPLWDEYPTTGPGFFTTPETGDELFMNPNTVTLFQEEEQDTFVGNFDVNGVADSLVQFIPTSLCASYALNGIVGNVRPFPYPDFGGGGVVATVDTVFSSWGVKQQVAPILARYVAWHQDSPFNNLYPERRKYIAFGKKDNAPAGCFPLAIAKILTHFEFPSNFVHDGYQIDWVGLNRSSIVSNIDGTSAAHLLRKISEGCDCWYFFEGTFTFPSKATSFMRSVGLNNAHSYWYNFDKVKAMIDNGCPLIIYSIPGVNVFKSHSWNIDGYKVKERTMTINTYENGVLVDTSTQTESRKMVHCDFGWRGKCNGYYISGVFDLDDPNVEHDPGTSYSGTTHYNNFLKIVAYDKP